MVVCASKSAFGGYRGVEPAVAVTCVAGKVDEPLEERDESARATGGEFSMPQAAPTSMGYHSCTGIEEGINIQQTGIERG